MANPYHDAEGKFCSAGEMKTAYEKLGQSGDLDGYFKLRKEYEEAREQMAPYEDWKKVVGTKIAAPTKKASTSKTGVKKVIKKSVQKAPIEVEKNTLNEPVNADLAGYIEYERDGWDSDAKVIIEAIPVRSVLGKMFRVPENQIPDSLVEHARDIGMDNPDNYEISTNGGYYGDEVIIQSENYYGLRRWYLDQNNARDDDGILDYVRSKGFDTSGKEPLDAIKSQLAAENNGKLIDAVTNARAVGTIKLSPKQISVANPRHLEEVDATPVGKKNEASDTFTGILVERPTNVYNQVEYVLVDGYHRYKEALKSPRKSFNFIVITPSISLSHRRRAY
jgi:hypothetical protein